MPRTIFPVEVIDTVTPISQEPYFQFLEALPTENGIVEYINTIKQYLGPKGFNLAEHILAPRVTEIFKMCHEVYAEGWLPDRTPMALEDLFDRTDQVGPMANYQSKDAMETRGFTIFGKPGRYNARAKLVKLLENRGLVYALNPYNFYFQINQDQLLIRYQFILGSRRVCNLKLDSSGENNVQN